MALYVYQALSKTGKKAQGTLDAGSVSAARAQLVKQGLYPISVDLEATSPTRGLGLSALFVRRIGLKEKIFFTKQLGLLLKSGVPLLQALDLLVEQTEGGLRAIVIQLRDLIKEGSSLADALKKYPATFDSTYVQLIRAGEASGKLEMILFRLATYLERRQEINRRVQKAVRKPLFELSFILLIAGGLLTFVVPKVAQTFASEGAKLPLPTRIMLALSHTLRTYYPFILGGLLLIFFLIRWWKSTPSGGRFLDALKLRIPIVRYFARMGAVVQFSRTLGILMEAGVNLSEALSIVSNIVDNRVLADTLRQARENILKQGRIAEYLKQTGLFPAVAIYLISTGEQSGKLDTMLLTVAEYYEGELSDYADNLSGKLGPLMTLAMGVIVGFIVISIALPLVKMGQLTETGRGR